MAPLVLLILFLASLYVVLHVRTKSRRSSRRLPPGSLGVPFVGQTLGYIRAMREGKFERWVGRRVETYGPVSKFLFNGTPTVLLTGPAANRLVFTDSVSFAHAMPKSFNEIFGTRNIFMLEGEDHRKVKGAVMRFMKPETLKQYVGKIDEVARRHIENNWTGKQTLKVLPMMKSFTFHIICFLVFGIRDSSLREALMSDFKVMMDAHWASVLGVPFLNLYKSTRASRRIRRALSTLVREKRAALAQQQQQQQQQQQSPNEEDDDLIDCLIGLASEDGAEALTDDEIVDNVMLIMFAGHDSTSILITFMIRQLANDPAVRAAVLLEQEEIAKSKASAEDALTWADLTKMKYTWCVALETLRMFPPAAGTFRKVTRDVEFNGYLIPKGWNVHWVHCGTHRDATIFQEPAKFDPTRFENTSPPVPPYSMVPFGGGCRLCPGNEFARIEALVMMHRLVTKFNWRLCCERDVYSQFPTSSPAEGLPISFEPINGSNCK